MNIQFLEVAEGSRVKEPPPREKAGRKRQETAMCLGYLFPVSYTNILLKATPGRVQACSHGD